LKENPMFHTAAYAQASCLSSMGADDVTIVQAY
jgi:hypothetical protein